MNSGFRYFGIGFFSIVAITLFQNCGKGTRSFVETESTESSSSNPIDDAAVGEKIYNANCVGCHRPLSESTIRGADEARIEGAFKTVTTMIPFNFKYSPDEVRGLKKYLAFPSSGTAPETCNNNVLKTEVGMLTPTEIENALMDIFYLTPAQVKALGLPSSSIGSGTVFDNDASLQQIRGLLQAYFEAFYQVAAQSVSAKYNQTLCQNAEVPATCARRIITALTTRAFREPLPATDIDPFMTLYSAESNFLDGMKSAVRGVLIDPRFIFKSQNPTPNGYDFASKLAFSITHSPPDEALLAKAQDGSIFQDSVIDSEIDRLLSNARASLYETDFIRQWFDIDGLASAPDAGSKAALQETDLFFKNLRLGGGPLSDILTARYSFINADLATIYNIPGVTGTAFNKVNFPANLPRQGVTGQSSFLRVTSAGTRTSPVLRGEYVRTKLLCLNVDPAPGMIQPINEDDLSSKSIREVLSIHLNTGTSCYNCHHKMDPYGWPLEYYGQTGGYRTTYEVGGFTVDGTSSMSEIGGGNVSNPMDYIAELDKTLIVKACIVQKHIQYGINRSLSEDEKCHARNVARSVILNSGRYVDLVKAIAKTPMFKGR